MSNLATFQTKSVRSLGLSSHTGPTMMHEVIYPVSSRRSLLSVGFSGSAACRVRPVAIVNITSLMPVLYLVDAVASYCTGIKPSQLSGGTVSSKPSKSLRVISSATSIVGTKVRVSSILVATTGKSYLSQWRISPIFLTHHNSTRAPAEHEIQSGVTMYGP